MGMNKECAPLLGLRKLAVDTEELDPIIWHRDPDEFGKSFNPAGINSIMTGQDGRIYSVNDILELTKDRPAHKLNPSLERKLRKRLSHPIWNQGDGTRISPQQVLDDQENPAYADDKRRIDEADLNYPILIGAGKDMPIIDGAHRTAKYFKDKQSGNPSQLMFRRIAATPQQLGPALVAEPRTQGERITPQVLDRLMTKVAFDPLAGLRKLASPDPTALPAPDGNAAYQAKVNSPQFARQRQNFAYQDQQNKPPPSQPVPSYSITSWNNSSKQPRVIYQNPAFGPTSIGPAYQQKQTPMGLIKSSPLMGDAVNTSGAVANEMSKEFVYNPEMSVRRNLMGHAGTAGIFALPCGGAVRMGQGVNNVYRGIRGLQAASGTSRLMSTLNSPYARYAVPFTGAAMGAPIIGEEAGKFYADQAMGAANIAAGQKPNYQYESPFASYGVHNGIPIVSGVMGDTLGRMANRYYLGHSNSLPESTISDWGHMQKIEDYTNNWMRQRSAPELNFNYLSDPSEGPYYSPSKHEVGLSRPGLRSATEQSAFHETAHGMDRVIDDTTSKGRAFRKIRSLSNRYGWNKPIDMASLIGATVLPEGADYIAAAAPLGIAAPQILEEGRATVRGLHHMSNFHEKELGKKLSNIQRLKYMLKHRGGLGAAFGSYAAQPAALSLGLLGGAWLKNQNQPESRQPNIPVDNHR